jgi:hypothetical protein
VEYFDRSQREAAWRWLMQPVAHSDGAGFLGTIGHFIRRNPMTTMVVAGALLALLVNRLSASR